MSGSVPVAPGTAAAGSRDRGAALAVALAFAVLTGLALVIPVSDLLALPGVYEIYGIGDAVPWALLVLAVALPPVFYVLGLVVARGRPPFERALVLTVALAVSFAGYFGIASLVAAIQPPIPL